MGKENGQFIPIEDVKPVKRYAPTAEAITRTIESKFTEEGPWRKVPFWIDITNIPADLMARPSINGRPTTIVPKTLYEDAKGQRDGTIFQQVEPKRKRRKKEVVKEVPQATVDSIAKVLFEQPAPPPQIPPEEMITQQPSVVPESQPATISTKPVNHFGGINRYYTAKNPRSRLRGPGSRSR